MAVLKMIKQETLGMEEAFEDFIRFSKSKNLADATIKNYQKQFRMFNLFYDSLVEGINAKVVQSYISSMAQRGVKPVSINTALRHLKAIFNYWAEQNFMQPVKITFQKYQEEIKQCYTEEECHVLAKKPDIKKCTFQEFRTWAIIHFFIGTGCRVQTLTNVKISDVDFDNYLITYGHTKNKKAQFVPLHSLLANVLHEYLKVRKGKPDELLFPSEDNTKLVETTVTHNIKMYCAKRKVRIGNSHLFRHTFVKNWIMTEGDPLKLQRILGHQTLTMVQHYANLYKTDLKVGFEEYNLLSKLATSKIKI